MPYYQKKIISGDYVEIEEYFSSDKRTQRGEIQGITPLSQAEQNEKQSQKKFIRQLHCNFDPQKGDILIHLTFAKEKNQEEAVKAFRNFELRAKRYCKKNNTEYKRLSVLENQGKWHIHAIISGLSSLTPLEIEKLWGHGRVTVSILDKSNNYKDLAAYLFTQEKTGKADGDSKIKNTKKSRPKYTKRWSGTRNLKKPVVEITLIKQERILRSVPIAPKGYMLLSDWYLTCDTHGHIVRYYSYIRHPEDSPKDKARQKHLPYPLQE